MSPNPVHGEMYSMQNYVIKSTGPWFFPGTPVSSTNKTDRHHITEILLNIIKPNQTKQRINRCISVFFLDAHCRHIFQYSLLLLDLKYVSYFFSSSLFCVFIFIFIYLFIYSNRIGGVMFNVLASSAVDRGFKPRLGQTKDYQIGICCFSAKHATLRRKSKDR